MKQHILGFALFNVIVITFGLIYAFLYVPAIPKVEEVKQPAFEYNYRSSCRKNKSSGIKQISTSISSSAFYVSENKIVTEVVVNLDSGASLPDKIYVTANYSATPSGSQDSFADMQIIENPFDTSRTRVITLVTNVSGSNKVKANDNLYVSVNVSDDKSNQYQTLESLPFRSVLKVFGKNSEKAGRGKGIMVRPNTVPQ